MKGLVVVVAGALVGMAIWALGAAIVEDNEMHTRAVEVGYAEWKVSNNGTTTLTWKDSTVRYVVEGKR